MQCETQHATDEMIMCDKWKFKFAVQLYSRISTAGNSTCGNVLRSTHGSSK